MCEYNSPCMGCEYYNKPYLSIISPCKNCPRVFGTSDYITTTKTNTKVKKYSNDITYLPTAKEYREAANKLTFQFTDQWSEPKYQCSECGGGMCKNLMVTLLTYPAQYMYRCDECGHIDYQHV